MFAGHLGAALILKDPKSPVGLGSLFFCAMFMDTILWVLVLAGVETVHIPTPLNSMADITFTFPYSHGLLAALVWSALAGLVVSLRWRNNPAAIVAAAAVFSHFLLDSLVHIPELPLAGNDSTKVGLGLWRNLPLAWSIETLMVQQDFDFSATHSAINAAQSRIDRRYDSFNGHDDRWSGILNHRRRRSRRWRSALWLPSP